MGLVVPLFLLGCAVERPTSRAGSGDAKKQGEARKAAQLVTPREAARPRIDEAQLVLNGCGRPATDVVLPIYDKQDHGPVRRMTFRGRRVVVVEFVPWMAAGTVVPTTQVPRPAPNVEMAADTVWEFSEARMENEELLTSTRLAVYLPCAAKALEKEE